MLKEVKIELTNRCARNCKHCSSSATNSSNNVKELGFEDIKKIIYEAKDMNVETIVFTGGEPLMYERLPELVKLTSKLGLKSTIYTFAYKTDETLNKYRQLIDLGLNKIVYSLAESLSDEEDASVYDKAEFFDKVFENNSARLGFHYTVSKDSFSRLKQVVNETIDTFKTRSYFDKVSLLRFVPHGKGTIDMDLSKEELLAIKKLYLNSNDKDKIRLGTPWNILGIENTPCIIADEIMIIGFDGIAYPCDSIKYFKKIGISGNIKENTLEEMYNSSYFSNIRSLNTDNSCSTCKDYKICKSGCIGQKIIANYIEDEDKVEVLKKCINSRDSKMYEVDMKKRQEVYDLYWYFACERQNIFIKKLNGEPAPWTKDLILQEYKFCNSYRVNDRVSQYLLKNVIYNGKSYSNEDMLFRILLFKLFNKESTWELLLNNFEDINLKNFNFNEYSSVLEKAISNGIKIYNDAYISCANKAFGYDRKHDNHLALLNKMFNGDKMQNKIVRCKTMEEAFNIIKSYPLIGNFMAYQLVTDINYSEVVNWKEDEFTVAGPGSLRGIKKCFIDKGKMSNEDIIKYMYEHQDEEFNRLGFDFKRIGNRPLQLIDCQNIFCELDKYCRQALPELKSNRTKIKKRYIQKGEKINYIYPPKWDIN